MKTGKAAKLLSHVAVLAVVAVVSGCASTPIDPDEIEKADEIQSGPGLLTGEKGAFVINVKRPDLTKEQTVKLK